MNSKKYNIDMCEGSLFPKIISFTLPLIFSSLLQLLFNAVDMIVAGRFVGKNALAAIGSTGSVVNLTVNVFLGISTACNVLVARYTGAKRERDVHETVHTSISLALIGGVLLTAIGFFLAPKLLVLMGTPNDVLPLSTLYLRIYFCGMPVFMLYNFGAAILRAVGDTRRPLIYLTIAGAINAVCNVIFIVVFHMGVDGVAYATVLSQLISAFLTIRCLLKTDENYRLIPSKLHLYGDKVGQLLRIGLPAGFQGAIFSISNVLIQSSVNSFGSDAMAGNSAAANIEGFVYVTMNSFHITCLSFVGQNYGAKKIDRVRDGYRKGLLIMICLAAVMIASMQLFGGPITSLFVEEPDIIAMGAIGLKITSFF